MNRVDAFAATVGVLLMEHLPGLPWQAPLPPELTLARGWYWAQPSGPQLLHVVHGDGLDAFGVQAIVTAWRAWLATLSAGESLLIVAWEADLPGDLAEQVVDDHAAWEVWVVDLGGQQLERPLPSTEPGVVVDPLFQVVNEAVTSYFTGTHLTLADLEEVEGDRLRGKAPFTAFLDTQKSPATWVLLALIAAFFGLTMALGGSNPVTMLRAGANFRPLVEQGEVWRLVTSNYLHFGVPHLLVNAYSLFAVGPMLEKLYGTAKFLSIYVAAGAAGAAASLAFNQGGVSAGASGALFGLLGAMLSLGLLYRGAIPDHQKRALRNVAGVTLVINLSFGLIVPNIDNFAHLGGLLGGAAMASVVGPHPILLGRPPSRPAQLFLWLLPMFAAVALVIGLRTTLSGRMPAQRMVGPADDFTVVIPIDLDHWFANQLLHISADHRQNQVEIGSVENWLSDSTPARPGLDESHLAVHSRALTRPYAALGFRLTEGPEVVTRGQHRFLRLRITQQEGVIEEAYVTASPDRIFAIRTRGLQADPGIRPLLDQILTSFDMKTVRGE